MKNETAEQERPVLRIEQPPLWWIEQRRKEIEQEENYNNNKSSVLVIDLNSNEAETERDNNGIITIKI